MRYTDVLALAMGQMVAAQTNTFTTFRFGGGNGTTTETATIGTETTGTETTGAATTTTGAAGGIGNPAGFNFLGCFSGNGFPGFALAYNSEDNDSDECAEKCAGSSFFGLNDGSCYCGSELDLDLVSSVSTDLCDIICPGDDSENCGGMITGSRIMRRQSVDINILLSIYVAIGVNPGATDTVINTDIITQTLDASTTTATVTFTESGVTATKTVIALLPVVPTDVIIICYGNYCAPQVHCPTCTKWQVVCEDDLCAPRECYDDTWNKIKICKNGSCYYSDYKEHDLNQRIICHGSSCVRETSEDYARKLVCDVDEDRYYFDTCKDDCYTYEKCSNGECEPVHPPVNLPKPVSPPKPVHSGKPPVVVVPEPKPEHPTKPNMPEHPETPSKPVKSGVPAKPEHPEAPAKPEQPAAKPQQPEHPETPAKPEQPETPSKEEHPEAPVKEVPVVTAGATKSFAGLAAAMAGFAFVL
ncbi:neurofilament medium polypeptide [Fusarium flagelliforme]|uniref:Neurofilament medium polypeptide n=1 Tax=Fusarium flagelliforme TaxID=2675880 RepID=A0A395MR32_9HYPO|nr:neurofilament medium polypeptide [Fusarium flagelliforme]